MFSDNKKSKSKTYEKESAKEQNKIAAGTVITGNIEAKGDFRIEGTLKGNLKTPGKIVLGKTGIIEGEVSCTHGDLAGTVHGQIQVAGTLTLRSSAKIEGETATEKLAVEPGANLNAKCTMEGAVKTLNDERPKKGRQGEKTA